MLLNFGTGDAPEQLHAIQPLAALTGPLYVRRAYCWVGGVHLIVYEVTSAIEGAVPFRDTLTEMQKMEFMITRLSAN